MKKFYLIFLVSLVVVSCKKEEDILTEEISEEQEVIVLENYLTETFLYKDISGVANNLLSLDIHFPDSIVELRPVVIYVHGGGWSVGDKASQINNKVNFCRAEHYILVSINYRLSPYPYDVNDDSRVKYPIHNIDIADAIKAVYDNIESYGGDKDKMALLGHSAGAQLVALIGTNPSFLDNVGLSFSAIKGVAAIDTRGYDIVDRITNVDNSTEMYINAFGNDEQENSAASAVLNVNEVETYPKFFIAKRGTSSRQEASNEFIGKLTQYNVSVDQVDGSVYNHEGINDAIGQQGETLISDPLRAFFETCFE